MSTDHLNKAKEAVEKALAEKKMAKELIASLGPAIVQVLEPILREVAENSRLNREDILEALKNAKIQLPPEVEVKLGEIAVPKAEVTVKQEPIETAGIEEAIVSGFERVELPAPQVTVNVPDIEIPKIEVPEAKVTVNFPDKIKALMDYDYKKPLPVIMMDVEGKPFQFSFGVGGGGGGKADHFTVKAFGSSAFAELTNPDGRLKVELPTGSSGLTDSELRATAVPVSQVSGASWSVSATISGTPSVSVTDIFGSVGTNVVNPDGRLKVELPTGSSGLTDAELRASSIPVAQASGAKWSTEATIVSVSDIFSTTATSTVVNPDNRVRVELPAGASGLTDTELRASSVPVAQASGAKWSTEASIVSVHDIFATTSTSNVVNTDNRVKVELPATTITGITNTIAAANVDSTGVQYSGSNPLPVYLVLGSGNSTISVGDIAADAVDTQSAPVKTGGIARTANPTAVANGDRVSASFDDLGRQIQRPFQVRDLTKTAYVSVTNGTETTLLAGVAGSFLDLVQVIACNQSTAAAHIDIRPVTAGNIVLSLEIPANSTAGATMTIPLPQQDTGNNWTVDMSDVTGTTVNISALFVQEI